MGKRITTNQHDYQLIEWLVKFYKDNSIVKYPAIQNLDELLEKFKP